MQKSIIIKGKEITFEKKDWTIRTNGQSFIRCGETEILATAVMSPQSKQERGFFPLTVNFEEKFYANGKILGSRYLRREGRPSENATLISRFIDRTIRPVFPKNFQREVQVIVSCLSFDEENDPDIFGILASSIALGISDIPWKGPIAAVRIGGSPEEMIINPSYEQRKTSLLDIVFSGLKIDNEIIINMIEAEAKEVNEETILKALELANTEIEKLISFQEEIIKEIGKKKEDALKPEEVEITSKIKELLENKVEEILFKNQETYEDGIAKGLKLEELKLELVKTLKENYPEKEIAIKDIFNKEVTRIVQEKILDEDKRADGRRLDEVRKIKCEIDLLKRAHGSGYFSRGITRSLSVLTLAGPKQKKLIEGIEIQEEKRFFHHYNFPPYSTGEAKPMRSPGRREIGHGRLAEKALRPMLPSADEFPYTMAITTEILTSNGSTSQASISSSSLALMAAGVPVKRHVAGIAIGLVRKDSKYKLLTDIQGPEDFHGQMDFKVAGTVNGITAIQMDVKTKGIDKKIMKEALEKAKIARLGILKIMENAIDKPRESLSKTAPKIFKIKINPEKIGMVIGSKGQTIKEITEDTGAEISIEDSGDIFILTQDTASAEAAIKRINDIVKEAKVGESFNGTVKKILSFGNIIGLTPSQSGLLRSPPRAEKLRIGDKIKVKVIKIDHLGRIDLGTDESSGQENQSSFKRGGTEKPQKKWRKPLLGNYGQRENNKS